MNIPKKFEGALFYTLQKCSLIKLPRVRTWQQIDADIGWTATNDRIFPVIDIRCSPPGTNEEDGCTQKATLAILVATNANDDPTHKAMSVYYEEVQRILDNLYAQFRTGTPGTERTKFDEYLASVIVQGDPVLSIGGFSHGEATTPFEQNSAYFTGLNFNIHFSRSDY